MNLILLEESETEESGIATLRDRRAHHVHGVLRSKPGDTLRVGLLEGPLGQAEVLASDAERTQLRCVFEDQTPARPQETLLLAVPRPIVLRRCLAHATALGFGRIVLFRSRCVDRSHLLARIVQDPEMQRPYLIAGLEQARRTRLPEVTLANQFRPFVEDDLPELLGNGMRCVVAHPEAELATRDLGKHAHPFCLALGPERGLLDHEIEKLEKTGFTAVHAGIHPLRVETALAFLTGQLQLLAC